MQHAKLQVLVSALSGRLLTSVFLVSMAHALPACCCHASTHSCMRQALGVPFSLLADEAAPPRPGPDAATLKNLTLLNQMQGNPQVNPLRLQGCMSAACLPGGLDDMRRVGECQHGWHESVMYVQHTIA